MIEALSLLFFQASPPVTAPNITVQETKMRLEGDFSCELRERGGSKIRVSGSVVDHKNMEESDRITFKIDATKRSRLSGTYYGFVNGNAIIMRNFVNYQSHMLPGVPRWADILLWHPKKSKGSLVIEAQKADKFGLEVQSFTGFCDVNLEQVGEQK